MVAQVVSFMVAVLLPVFQEEPKKQESAVPKTLVLEVEPDMTSYDPIDTLLVVWKLSNSGTQDVTVNLEKDPFEPVIKVLVTDPDGVERQCAYTGSKGRPMSKSVVLRHGEFLKDCQFVSLSIFRGGDLGEFKPAPVGAWSIRATLGPNVASPPKKFRVAHDPTMTESERQVLARPEWHLRACGNVVMKSEFRGHAGRKITETPQSRRRSQFAFLLAESDLRSETGSRPETPTLCEIARESASPELLRKLCMQTALSLMTQEKYDEAERVLALLPREDGNVRQKGVDNLLERIRTARKAK